MIRYLLIYEFRYFEKPNAEAMYYIRKSAEHWAVHNNQTRKRRHLSEEEVQCLLQEFPNLKLHAYPNSSVTYFRNRIRSIADLP